MGLAETYDFYWNQNVDQRTNSLPLMSSPFMIPFILFSYLYFVLKCGPDYMKNKKPYDLKTFVKFYNVFQVVSNAYIVYTILTAGWFNELSVFCEIPDYSTEPGPMQIAYAMWVGTLLKVVDLIETGVFVLRKKNRQISFLHLYHHVSTILLSWQVTRYVPVAMSSFNLMVNCFIHVIMYSYYFLSTFGPKMQRFLNPFKRFITILQMVQFIVLILYNIQTLMPSCHVPRLPGSAMIAALLINFILFYNFYQKNYKKPVQKTS